MNTILKLSSNSESKLSARDIAIMHYGYCLTNGKVTYTTNIRFASDTELENVLLAVGGEKPLFYWCHVADKEFYEKGKADVCQHLDEFSPTIYQGEPKATWLLFDKMELIPEKFANILRKNPDLLNEVVASRPSHRNIPET